MSALPTLTSAALIKSPPKTRPRLALHPGQMEVYQSRARFKVVVAGRRWGKTQLAKIALIRAAAGKPKQLVWYVAPSYRMAKQIMWEELKSSVPRRWIASTNETYMTVVLKNGSRIELKGADKPDSLRGVGLHYLVLDEFQDMRDEVWLKVLRPTLASTRGQALVIGTPKSFNLLHTLYQLGQKEINRLARTWFSWQYPTITSPFIPASEVEAAREDMDEKSFRQEFEASFETMSGRVYHCFNRHRHVGHYPFNPDLPVWVGQDFNVDPMSSVILQPQPDGTIWAVDEIVLFSSNVQEVAEELERRYWRVNPKKIVIFPDPAGGNRSHARGETALDVFREKGFKQIRYRKKHPPVQDRVNVVNKLLLAANGETKLYVNEPCKHLIKSLEQVIYKDGTPEIDKSAGIEHSADAVGYPLELLFPMKKFKAMGVSI